MDTKPPSRRRPSVDLRLQPGRASDYIRYAPEELRRGDVVVLFCRVSEHPQQYHGNLADQEVNLIERADHFGVRIIDVVRCVGSGTDPCWLVVAAEKARQCNAKLFAESTDRLVRHPAYHSKTNPNAQAREPDLQDLQLWTAGVTLVSDVHPDASPHDVRSYQRKRGQRLKGNRGGRPQKRPWKERRLALQPLAQELRAADVSYQAIADRLNVMDHGFPYVTAKTIWNWLNRPCKFL